MENMEFVEKYRKGLRELTDIRSTSDYRLMEENLARLERIHQMLSISKYKLVFMGKPGSGKTTAICNYLDLLRNKDEIVGSPFYGHGGIALFNTGSGKTTAFEVRCKIGEESAFRIYPKSVDEQKKLIREYCELKWNDWIQDNCSDVPFTECYDDDNDRGSGDNSQEYERIIKNMLGDVTECIKNCYDEYGRNGLNHFSEVMYALVSPEKRTCTYIAYSDNSEPIKKWIKRKFDQINNGKCPDVAIPECVDVILNPQMVKMPDWISEVIDTRGYDGEGTIRDDLQAYLTADDTIIALMDELPAVPDLIQKKILHEWIESGDKDMIPRVALFVRCKEGDLEDVNEADGNPERGEQIKRGEIKSKVQSLKLNYDVNNTLFLNSYDWIIRKRNIISELDEERHNDEHIRITEHLCCMVERFKESLKAEADTLRTETEKLYEEMIRPSLEKQCSTFLEQRAERLKALRDRLVGVGGGNGELEREFSGFSNKFCMYFRKEHAHYKTIRATSIRTGTWYKAHIYREAADFAYRCAGQIIRPEIDQMKAYIKDSQYENLRPFLTSCLRKVDSDYIKLRDTIRYWVRVLAVRTFAMRVFEGLVLYTDYDIFSHRDNTWWDDLESIEVSKGYCDNVMDECRNRMDRRNFGNNVCDMVIQEVEKYFNGIISLLEDKSKSI